MASTPPTLTPGPLSRTPGGAARSSAAPALVPAGARRQRRWSLALIAILVTLGSALAFVVLWLNAGDRKPVLAVRHDIAPGQRLVQDDLVVVRVAADSDLALIPSSARDDVVGQVALVELLGGSLIAPDAIDDEGGLDPGTGVIGIPVKAEELPQGLRTGDTVRVLSTQESSSGDGEDNSGVIADARVSAVVEHDTITTVSLTIQQENMVDIANAVQAENFILVLLTG